MKFNYIEDKMKQKLLIPLILTIIMSIGLLNACTEIEVPVTTPTTPITTTPITPTPTTTTVQQESINSAAWSSNVNISFETDTFTFKSDGIPSHGVLDAYLGKGANGFFIAEDIQSYNAEFSIPLNPVMAATPTETPMGVIGVAVSGAVFFDAFEGGADADVYAVEDNTVVDGVPFIDSCNGHGLPTGLTYHYHGIPYCISDALDTVGEHSKITGYLLDGYPIYGPQDVNGAVPTDLDACNSHFGPTPEYPEGIQHYHTTETAPYIANCYVGEVTGGGTAPTPNGNPPTGNPPTGGVPDFTTAAGLLGVSVEVLMAALGGPPPNIEAAAATLGVTVEYLTSILPAPPNQP